MSTPKKAWLAGLSFLALSLVGSIWVANAQGTSDTKVVQLEPGLPGDPFQVIGLTEGTEPVTFAVPFSAGDDLT